MIRTPEGFGIHVEIADYENLGRMLANADSTQQAHFLLGLQSGLGEIPLRRLQLTHVAERIEWEGKSLKMLLDLLDEHLRPEPEPQQLPLHRTEAGGPGCATCDGGGCPDCTDPAD